MHRGLRLAGHDRVIRFVAATWCIAQVCMAASGPSHSGVAYDAFEACARGQHAKAFCEPFKLNLQASFAIQAYGQDPGFALACAWCSKMHILFDQWSAEGSEAMRADEILALDEAAAVLCDLCLCGSLGFRTRVGRLQVYEATDIKIQTQYSFQSDAEPYSQHP